MVLNEATLAARASAGGRGRMQKLSKAERKALASAAAKQRWAKARAAKSGVLIPGENASPTHSTLEIVSENKGLPNANWPGVLTIGNVDIPVYVLTDRRRIVSRTGATS